MTTENQPDPFEGFASPTQKDIDVALMDAPFKVEQHEDGSKTIWFRGEDEHGKSFAVGILNKVEL